VKTAPTLAVEYADRLRGDSDIKDEMPYLLARAEGYQQVRVLELGVRAGRSTSAFLAAAARVHGHVWSVDVNPPDVPDRWRTCGYWTFTQIDDMCYAPELGWDERLGPRFAAEFDILFIDTSHEVVHTLAELRKFVPYVAAGGVVLCHDTKLTDPADPAARPYVAQALDLFCAERTLQSRAGGRIGGMCWEERGGRYGLGVIEAPNG
jgi:predicted O-methyltransferase YrrM